MHPNQPEETIMYDLQAIAIQTRSGIYVHAEGLLENTCMRARITGTYPGNIFHIVDPGFAEVFISEWQKPKTEYCAPHLIPWADDALIPDFEHKKVALYVNGDKKLTIDVIGVPLERKEIAEEWIVTALVGSPKDGPFYGCALHHKDDIILAIYRKVFGPASKKACEDILKKHCKPLTA
jgi:hypothetical protein